MMPFTVPTDGPSVPNDRKHHGYRAVFRRVVRWTVGILIVLLLMLIIVIGVVQIPAVQRTILHTALSSVPLPPDSRIDIGSVSFGLPNTVVLNDVLVEVSGHDTVLAVGTLAVDVNLLGVLQQKITLRHIRIDSATIHLVRSMPDSSFNFDPLIDAFSPAASPDTLQQDTVSGSAWDFTVNTLQLRAVRFVYEDAVSGTDLRLAIGEITASVDSFNITPLRFAFGDVELLRTTGSFASVLLVPSDTAASTGPTITIRSLQLGDVHFVADIAASNLVLNTDIASSTLSAARLDLVQHHLGLSDILLNDSRISIRRPAVVADVVPAEDPSGTPWTIDVGHAELWNNGFTYDDRTLPVSGLDIHHLSFERTSLGIHGVYVGPEKLTAVFEHASFTERSGMVLRELSGAVVIDSSHAEAAGLVVAVNASRFDQDVLLRYSSREELDVLAGTLSVRAVVRDSHVALSDLLFFVPTMPLNDSAGAVVRFSADITGRVDALNLSRLSVTSGASTAAEIAGAIHGYPGTPSARYDLTLRSLTTGRDDIRRFVSDSLLPRTIRIPDSIRLSGVFKGTVREFSASALVTTTIGTLEGALTMSAGDTIRHTASRWSMSVIGEAFNAGELLRDTTMLGPATFTATAAGTGGWNDGLRGDAHLLVSRIRISGYDYSGIALSASGGQEQFTAEGTVQDPFLDLNFQGKVSMDTLHPAAQFMLTVAGADLQQLAITGEDIRVSGTCAADITGGTLRDLGGSIALRDIVIMKGSVPHRIDSLIATVVRTDSASHLSIASPMFDARFDGTIVPEELPALFRRFAQHYVPNRGAARIPALQAQAFSYQIVLRDPSLLTTVFIPELTALDAGTIEGSFDSEHQRLAMRMTIPRIVYNAMALESLTVTATSDMDRLQAALMLRSAGDSTFHITGLSFTAEARNDSFRFVLHSDKKDGFVHLNLAAVVTGEREGYALRFIEKGTVMHNVAWSIPKENDLHVGKDGTVTGAVRLRSGPRSIAFTGTPGTGAGSVVAMHFDEVSIPSLTAIALRDSGFIGGTLNGTIKLSTGRAAPMFAADMSVTKLTLAGHDAGDVLLQVHTTEQEHYDVTMKLTGRGSSIAVNGTVNASRPNAMLDLALTCAAFDLAALEPLTVGMVDHLTGTMSGTLHLTGTPVRPVVTGALTFTGTEFTPTMLGTHLSLNASSINFTPTGIGFDRLVLTDIHGNTAAVNGRLLTRDYRTYDYDLHITSRNFLLLNKPDSRDASYFGTVVINSDGAVRSDGSAQIVTLQAGVVKGTNVALVMPASHLAVEERRGIVRFDGVPLRQHPIMSGRNERSGADTIRTMPASMDIRSNISVTKESKLRILIDPVAGDSLVLQGDAAFSVTVDPAGKLSVTGRYGIVSGVYQLSFGDFIARTFVIANGSSLTWLGSPLDAEIDITAQHTVRTSVLDLVQSQLSGMTAAERTRYRQKLPIQLIMHMTGALRSPVIHFRLDLPADQRGVLNGTVYAKLNDLNTQESELNKQVFALLVLGRFVQENPIASADGGTGASDIARSSVSQLLSAQLNRLSERYIAGASLDVGVDSYKDYSTGTASGRTQLQLALSKRLFNDRVTVQAGGNVDLEGERNQKNTLNSVAGDLVVQYMLTEDGRWQLRAFRQNAYEGALDGDIVKTGAGIAFSIDFDKLYGITLKPLVANDNEP